MNKDPDRDLIDRIDSAISEEIRETLEKVLAIHLKPILEKLEVLDERLSRVEKEQIKQGKVIKKIQKTLDFTIKVFNKEDMKLYKRMQRIETHLGLPRFE